MSMDPRAAAARVLARVVGHGEALQFEQPGAFAAVADQDQALLRELCYGTLRWAPRLEFFLSQLLRRSLRKREPEVHCLLLCGLYQLLEMRIPAHAAVNQTVAATRELDKAWASKLVNAVLRRMQREAQQFKDQLETRPVPKYAHPAWLVEQCKRDWPRDWHRILAANNERPPLTLRVNLQQGRRGNYLDELRQAGFDAKVLEFTTAGIQLAEHVDVRRLPGFSAGKVSVQDAAAQLAAAVLDLKPGHRVLDACAAPGGKAAHVLETEPGLALLAALDIDADRLDRVAENLARLQLAAKLVCGDATRPDDWWDGEPFDRILLDAPCTASGVIRRHPDIKLLRRAGDTAALAARQAEMLDKLWPLLAPTGKLVYATCSVFQRENADQVANFIARHDDAVAMPIAAEWGVASGFGRQVLPGDRSMDGFFYACLVKQAE